MRPPCEVVVKQLLPVLRAHVARDLMHSHGWTQSQIAIRLGVTQPAVSSYLALLDKQSTSDLEIEEISNAAEAIARGLASNELTTSETVMDICQLCIRLKSGGILCSRHRLAVQELQKEGCEVCSNLFIGVSGEMEERHMVLADLREAVDVLQAADAFAEMIPEVRSNIVMALSGASTISQVAGIPGRMVEIRGKARAFEEPEFGSSYHLAKELLAAIRIDGTKRAVINIKYDVQIQEAMERLGFTTLTFSREETGRSSTESKTPAIQSLMEGGGIQKIPDAIIDRGGQGIEPVTYLFARTSVEAAKRAISVAREVRIRKVETQ